MSAFKGDYMGFSFGKKEDGTPMHSSDLGIVRTSSGSRFNENLLPTMQDKTVQVPGGDGTYYFGSYYTQRQFTVSFAFDSLTEEQIARIKRVFGDKGVHDLIFDETPYKVYSAKVTGNATLKYLAFDEGNTHRLYKGEGTIQFTCYDPFARCYSTNPVDYGMVKESVTAENYKPNTYYYHNTTQKKFILDSSENFDSSREYYTSQNVQEVNEWWAASRISEGGNFGDVAVPFTLVINSENGSTSDNKISWNGFPIKCVKDDKEYSARGILNTRIGVVVQEYQSTSGEWEQTGAILNNCFSGDLISKIPVGQSGPTDAQFTCLYY